MHERYLDLPRLVKVIGFQISDDIVRQCIDLVGPVIMAAEFGQWRQMIHGHLIRISQGPGNDHYALFPVNGSDKIPFIV